MSRTANPPVGPAFAAENASRVAVVAVFAATTMLFASLVSAYLVRRSFVDWRPTLAVWPVILLAFGCWASLGIEVACRSTGTLRRRGLIQLGLASGLYLLGALAVIGSMAFGPDGLAAPHRAFVALLLGVHVVHATLGAGFAAVVLRDHSGHVENSFALVRIVTHFLTALLFAVLLVLFVLR